MRDARGFPCSAMYKRPPNNQQAALYRVLGHSSHPGSLTQVVEAALREDLGAGLEPGDLGGRGDVELRGDAAQGTEEGPPAKSAE